MKSAEHGAVDRGESCQYNRTPAKQRVKKGILVARELRFRAFARVEWECRLRGRR